jgi:hypothetical protein
MSFKTCLVVIRDTTLDELPVRDRTALSFESVSSSAAGVTLAAAQIGPHVVLVDPLYGELVSSVAAARGRQVVLIMLGGVADTYVIEARGPVTRLLVRSAGQVVQDEGRPLAAEEWLDWVDDREGARLAALEAVMEAPFTSLWEAAFVTVETVG